MKIAVAAMGDRLEDQVAFRLGRNAYYLLVDTESMDVEPIENPDKIAGCEASEVSASLMADRGVQVVLAGHCGPDAHKVFSAVQIAVLPGITGTVSELVDELQQDSEWSRLVATALEPFAAIQEQEEGPSSKKRSLVVAYEDMLQMKAEMVVMQRKLLELHRRVAVLEKK